jgi:hypothetical protein
MPPDRREWHGCAGGFGSAPPRFPQTVGLQTRTVAGRPDPTVSPTERAPGHSVPRQHEAERRPGGSRAARSRRQAGAALVTTSTKNGATAASAHPRAETMLLGPLANVWLIWTLHCVPPRGCVAESGGAEKAASEKGSRVTSGPNGTVDGTERQPVVDIGFLRRFPPIRAEAHKVWE